MLNIGTLIAVELYTTSKTLVFYHRDSEWVGACRRQQVLGDPGGSPWSNQPLLPQSTESMASL